MKKRISNLLTLPYHRRFCTCTGQWLNRSLSTPHNYLGLSDVSTTDRDHSSCPSNHSWVQLMLTSSSNEATKPLLNWENVDKWDFHRFGIIHQLYSVFFNWKHFIRTITLTIIITARVYWVLGSQIYYTVEFHYFCNDFVASLIMTPILHIKNSGFKKVSALPKSFARFINSRSRAGTHTICIRTHIFNK